MNDIKFLQEKIHKNNIEKGFYQDEKNIGEMLCLVHSEVSEALECDRKDKYCELHNENWKDGNETLLEMLDNSDDVDFKVSFERLVKDSFEDELSDIVIRVLDLAEYKKIDLYNHILLKMRYNSLRGFKHGKKY